MNRGIGLAKLFAAVALLAAAMLFASGCGDDASNSAESPAGPTAALGAEGATGSSGEDRASDKQDADDKSKSDDSGSAEDERPASPSSAGQKALKSEVTIAFNRLMKAFRDRDYDYVCSRAYSRDYVEELNKRGGCESVVEEEIGSVKSTSGSVKRVTELGDTLVEANVVLRITPKSGATAENDTQVHFKKQAGEWKYFVYTGENG